MYTLTTSTEGQGVVQQFSFSDDAFPEPTGIPLNLDVTGQEDFYQFPLDFAVGPDFVVHSEMTDQVHIFRRETNAEVSDAGQFSVAESCSIGATQVGDSTAAFEPLGLIVGTPNGLTALLFAGDSHTSDHQLTIVHQYFGGPVEQVDIALPHGIPSNLYVAPINGISLGTDIIITVPETPYAYVLENISPFSEVQFAPIEYVDVGFGVTEVDQIRIESGPILNYLVTNDGETLSMYPSIP